MTIHPILATSSPSEFCTVVQDLLLIHFHMLRFTFYIFTCNAVDFRVVLNPFIKMVKIEQSSPQTGDLVTGWLTNSLMSPDRKVLIPLEKKRQ